MDQAQQPDAADRAGVIKNPAPIVPHAKTSVPWRIVTLIILPILVVFSALPWIFSRQGVRPGRLVLETLITFTILATIFAIARRQSRRGGRPAWAGGVIPLIMMTVMTVNTSAAQNRPWLLSFLGLVPNIAPMFGAAILMLAFRPRTGDSLHCARCGYDYIRGHDAPDLCPECGAGWLAFHGLVRGKRPRFRWWLAGAGVVTMAMPFVLLQNQSATIRFAPTTLLITRIGDPQNFFPDQDLKALSSRSLSQRQVRTLAEALLRKRPIRTILARSEDAWFESGIASGSLPQDLIDRYQREMAEFWIVAPSQARAGGSITVGLGVADHSQIAGARAAAVIVGGYWFDDSPTRVGRSAVSVPALTTGAEHRAFGATQRAQHPFEATLSTPAPGTHTLHLELWLLITPRPQSQPIAWAADGSPIPPPGALWSERLDLVKEVRIAP